MTRCAANVLSHNVSYCVLYSVFCTRSRSWVLHVCVPFYFIFLPVGNFLPQQVHSTTDSDTGLVDLVCLGEPGLVSGLDPKGDREGEVCASRDSRSNQDSPPPSRCV